MNFHFRPPRFKDPPPSSPHSGFHPLFSAVFTRGRRVVAPWHLLLSFDPSTRPSNPSFSSNPSLPSASPSFFLVFSLSNFFAFFHFLRFLSVDKAKRHFPSFVSFSSFFLFFYYSCLWFLVSPSSFSSDRFLPEVERRGRFSSWVYSSLVLFRSEWLFELNASLSLQRDFGEK